MKKIILFITFVLVLTCNSIATEKKAWEELNLSSTSIEGTTIYYEKYLESKLPFFESRYKQFLAEKESFKKIEAKKKQIIDDINKILGITNPDIEKQNRNLSGLLGAFSFENTVFYIVLQDTTKSFLAEGGQLPNFTYDKSDNTVTYNPEFIVTSEDRSAESFEFAFLIASEETFDDNINLIFQILQDALGSNKLFVAIHELVEFSLLNRAEPADTHWRWFSDGFANAITFEILKKHAGFEIAQECAKSYYIGEYKDLEKEINLRYWMGLSFSIQTPLKYENKLSLARYAYATQEAQRLIEMHGIGCVSKIIDKILTKKNRTSQDIFQAVNEVTGEDVQQRFNNYQTFETRQEGLAKYGGLFNTALENKDYEQMLINLLRVLELQENLLSPSGLQCYKEIAFLLFRMGYEEAGDNAMHTCIEFFKNKGTPMAHQAAMETFIIYAFSCNNAKKALEISEQLLKNQPDHVLALTVKMVVHAEAGEFSQAKEIAQKVITLDKNEQSPSRRTATQILAKINQQETNKEP